MKTLIAYTSKYGCTKKCVELLAKELNGDVDIKNIKENTGIDISKYDKIIIGGSIYMGMIQKELKNFCTKNINGLKNKNLGLFICGMQEGDNITTEINQNFSNELIQSAKVKKCFGGEFNFNKMNVMERMIVKKISKVSTNTSRILNDDIHQFAVVMNSI